MSQSSSPLLQEEIEILLKKPAVERVQNSGTPGFYSRIFLVPKKNGKLRLIIDLSLLNRYLEKQSFKIETIKSVRQSIKLNDWAVSIGLTDAYITFRYILTPESIFHSSAKIRSFTSRLTVRNVPKSVDFLKTNGRHSSVLTPTCHISLPLPRRLVDKRSDSQSIDFSDKILYTNNSKSRFSSKSKEIGTTSYSEIHIHRHVISDSAKFSQGSNGSCREPNSDNQINYVMQTSIGTNFLFSLGQTQCNSRFCSPRQTSLTSPANVSSVCLKPHILPLDHPIPNTGMIRSILQWWMNTNRFETGTLIHPPDPKIFLSIDASHFGWGAHLQPTRLSLHGRWTEDQSQLHINMLEMMAIQLALKQVITFFHHSCIMISTDNTTVVSYINKQGGTHPPNLCVEVWELLN